MFRGLSPNDYPDPRIWLDLILTADSTRVNDRGEAQLTRDEVLRLQQAGYTAVIGAGWWPIPQLPLDWLRPHPALARLVTLWYGARALDPSTDPPAPQPPRKALPPADRLQWRLHDALRQADQQRLLLALLRQSDGPIPRRQFRHGVRRLATAPFNAALAALLARSLVTRDGRWLTLDPEVRRLLEQAGMGVRRSGGDRAKRRPGAPSADRHGTTWTQHKAPAHSMSTSTSQSMSPTMSRPRRPYRPRPVPDRRRHPHEWGRSMRARLGGLTVQRLYRKFGVHPTQRATDAIKAKRAQQEPRVATVGTPPPPASFAASPSPGSPSHSTSAAALSAALAYNQPIGRRERLAVQTNRRR